MADRINMNPCKQCRYADKTRVERQDFGCSDKCDRAKKYWIYMNRNLSKMKNLVATLRNSRG